MVILVLVVFAFQLKDTQSAARGTKLQHKLRSMDPVGVILLLGAVCSLFLVLQQGGNAWSWKSSQVIGLLFAFVVLSVAFGVVQWRLRDGATIPLRLLKDRTVVFGSLFLASSNASSYVVSGRFAVWSYAMKSYTVQDH